MRVFDALLGRRKPRANQLDALFALPTAAITLQTGLGFDPTGQGSVCYRAATGAGGVQAQEDAVALLGDKVERTVDEFDFTWLTSREPDISALCTGLHGVNTSLAEHGFAESLLCSLVPFADTAGRRLGLVYLYKSGTFYPFAPTGKNQRDNMLEIQVRDALTGELPMETDLSRWMALWGAPGL